MKKEIRARIHGKVQMVMFRDFVVRKAKGLGIVGTVENCKDGSVEVIAEGDEEALKKLIGHLEKGPLFARVVRVDVSWGEPTGSFVGFNIIY